MQKLQEDYLFLVRHDIQTAAGVAVIAESMTDKKKDTSKEKSRIFKERAKMKPLFDIASELGELSEMESCYQKGERLFEKEHEKYVELRNRLKKEGYSVEQLEDFKLHYKNEIARIREKEKAVSKEERIAKRILAELMEPGSGKEPEKRREPEKEENRKVKQSRQPIR